YLVGGGGVDVIEAVEVLVVEAGAVVEEVQGYVGAEVHIHHRRPGPGESRDLPVPAVLPDLDRLDPAPAVLTGEEPPVERLGELDGRVQARVVAVDGTAHRRLRPGAELGRAPRVPRVPDPRRLRRRQCGQAGVAEGVVGRAARAVVLRAGAVGGEVRRVVGLGGGVRAGAVRPAVVARTGDAVELHLLARPAAGVRHARVRPVVAEVDDAGRLVHAHPERVAEAHRVDLRPGPGRAR